MVEFARPVELPAGARETRFTVARTRPGAMPGGWIFVCQHHTPEVVWCEDYLEHPNGAQGILEVVGVASNLSALAQAWEKIFGPRLHTDTRSVAVEGQGAAIRFLEPETFRRRYGWVGGAVPATREPDLAAFRLAVRNVEAVAEVLRRYEVPFHILEGGAIGVAPDHACGATLEFSERTT